ncbi:unnamed protein product [Rotaria sp. Silwood1]|nr:unnamed protein product [Rotaria sp. Silwood1]CAF0833920.1 unnamed protein product [Rotaria sp. Silwood1]CAF3361436.1 unnamed protein product [Rotaria sp. Silwood1]CAF3403046.1 unnamed protein product [Rotaria sp. Silwood1]CAF4735672.1 unnamed protein product [Rotaria sp. Silwood1]
MVPWRQSASLILLGQKQVNNIHGKSLFDYSSLLLKRSPKMRFAPDVSAFPGGQLDSCDLSLDWPKYLSSSINIDRFSKKNVDIYKDIDHPYPGLVFRLCAIRETFEETGLLLAKSRTSSNSNYATIPNLSNNIIDEWRNKIRHDASQFIVMCKEIQIEPDVDSLFEWSQYLAAAIAKVRFDTIFYIAPLSNTYSCLIAHDDHETVSADWLEPDIAMNEYYKNSINFLPPQIYELSRLGNFQKLSNLIEYLSKCKNDSEYQIKRMLGICYKIPEAMLLIMPGDEHYPLDASFTTPILSSNQTLKDFDSKIQNRLVMMNKGDNRKWQVHYKDSNENRKNQLYVKPLTDGWEKL